MSLPKLAIFDASLQAASLAFSTPWDPQVRLYPGRSIYLIRKETNASPGDFSTVSVVFDAHSTEVAGTTTWYIELANVINPTIATASVVNNGLDPVTLRIAYAVDTDVLDIEFAGNPGNITITPTVNAVGNFFFGQYQIFAEI